MKNDFFRVTKLGSDLWAIEDKLSNEHAISYLIRGQKRALLFDTGLGLAPLSLLVQQLTNLPVLVVLSHWHFDHSGSAHEFENVIGWQSEKMQTASLNGIGEQEIAELVGTEFSESITPHRLEVKPFPCIKLINKESLLDIGGYSFKILHTPGHTKDSICLYETTRKWLLSGDSVYPGEIYLQFEDSGVLSYKKSIERLMSYKIKTILPGHNATTIDPAILAEIDNLLRGSIAVSNNYPSLSIKA